MYNYSNFCRFSLLRALHYACNETKFRKLYLRSIKFSTSFCHGTHFQRYLFFFPFFLEKIICKVLNLYVKTLYVNKICFTFFYTFFVRKVCSWENSKKKNVKLIKNFPPFHFKNMFHIMNKCQKRIHQPASFTCFNLNI